MKQLLKLLKKRKSLKISLIGWKKYFPNNLKRKNIQCVSLGLIIFNNKILAYSVKDTVSEDVFYRLIGGHIEFGEKAEIALKREFKEEIDKDINIIKKIDVFENLYFYNGHHCHEFVSLFLAEFVDDRMYDIDSITGNEGPLRTYEAYWVPVEEFENNDKVLYPPEILKYLS